MRTMRRTIKVTKERAIQIAINLNCISREIAEKYTDSELKECLALSSGRTYKLVANF